MTTENVEGQEGQIENTEDVQVQSTPVEKEALEQGWVPKEEFKGDPAKWVEAGEFLRRGELFSKIDVQNKHIKRLEQMQNALQEHYTKVNQDAYNRALADIKKQIKLANREGDYDRADALEEQAEVVAQQAEKFKEEMTQAVQVEEQAPAEFVAWVNKNPWYQSTPHMRVFAEEEGRKLHQAGGLSPQQILKKVEEAVRKEFPNKFNNPNREAPGAVEAASRRTGTKKDDFQLNEQETKIMNNLISQKDKNGKPFMTKEQYIADLKKIKGVA